jgi:hypothetical protein
MRTLRFTLFVTMVAAGLAFARPTVGFCGPTSPPPPPSATAACYFFGFSCTGSTCTCVGTLSAATVESVDVKENPRGREDLVCKGDIPENAAPKHAVKCEGPADGICMLTGLPHGGVSGHIHVFTQDWQEVITRSGHVTLRCHDLEPLGS